MYSTAIWHSSNRVCWQNSSSRWIRRENVRLAFSFFLKDQICKHTLALLCSQHSVEFNRVDCLFQMRNAKRLKLFNQNEDYTEQTGRSTGNYQRINCEYCDLEITYGNRWSHLTQHQQVCFLIRRIFTGLDLFSFHFRAWTSSEWGPVLHAPMGVW